MADMSGGDDGGANAPPSSPILRGLTVVSALALFGLLAVTFADVIGRYFLNAPITGAQEFIAFSLGVTVFAAFPLVTRDRAHITVDIFARVFRGRVRYAVRLVVLLGTFGAVAFVSRLLFEQAETMREAGFLTEYMDLPQAPIVYVLSALAAIAALIFLGVIWRYLKEGGDPRSD